MLPSIRFMDLPRRTRMTERLSRKDFLAKAEQRGRPMTPAKRKRAERLQVDLSADQVAAIDQFRFQARIPS